MSHTRCEVCGEEAKVHVTEVAGGKVSARHFCERHAEGVAPRVLRWDGNVLQGADRMAGWMMLKMLGEMRRFVYRHGRLPATMEELKGAEVGGEKGAGGEIVDPVVRKKVMWMERMQAFVEKHGWVPQTVEEWAEVEGGLD
ncbi:MAG TPA: hypothetical protein VHQ47_01155 [Phycisphaerae bacterium]|nr:hypothetical protein [Phycisphaerae bacterium]